MLGLPEQKVRVIAPDVGGGFGGKNRIMPEDVAVAAIALKVKHPVRWIEDRREHLLASVHARDHTYDLTISADRDGTLLGIEGDIYIDAGAYALWPTGAFQEASMASRNLTGPYRIPHLKLNAHTVATNKAPMGPYRGVARPGATFALERLVDEVARELRYWEAEAGDSFDADHGPTIVRLFAAALPAIRRLIDSDVAAAFQGDPAARSVDERRAKAPRRRVGRIDARPRESGRLPDHRRSLLPTRPTG